MRVETLQENFRKALATVSRAANHKSTLPILANVLLATDDGRLRLSCTNLDCSITTWVGAKVDTEGSVTLPAKLLGDTLAGLPNEKVSLDLIEQDVSVNVACKRTRANIKGIESDEFPTIASHTNARKVATIQPDVLAQAISRTAFCFDVSHGALGGVNMVIGGDSITFRAADGHRAVKQVSPAHVELPLDVIIPAPIMATVGAVLAGAETDVEIFHNDGAGLVLFHTENLDIAARLIAGTFPDVERIVPQHHNTRAIVQADEFLRALKLATVYTTGEFKPLKFELKTIEEGQAVITVASRAAEIGNADTAIDCELAGDDNTIQLDAEYIASLVSACKSPQIAIELQNPTAPAVIRPVGDDSYLAFMMPIVVR